MEALQLIKINSTGLPVENWQSFLRGQGLYMGEVDGEFGPKTLKATIAFQKLHDLQPDGKVGNKTFGAAMQLGFPGIFDPRPGIEGMNFPPPPAFPPLVTNQQRIEVFGEFSFVAEPEHGNPEHIRITDDWESNNIVIVNIPQLTAIKGSPRVRFHKLAASQLTQLWADWEAAGLLHLILEWDGSFEPRFVRGSRTILSNHSFGSAFDMNEPWNQFHTIPALVGQKGSVRELVQIANRNGFYWGGHFSKPDGMHFEIAQIL